MSSCVEVVFGLPTLRRTSSQFINRRRVCPSFWLSVWLLCAHARLVVPSAIPIPSLGPAMLRLTEQLALLTSSHAKNTAALDSLAREREDLGDREKELRVMVENAEDKRAWFGNFREWVESVAAFLDEKVQLFFYGIFNIELNVFLLVSDVRKARGRIYFTTEREGRNDLQA